MNKIVSLFAIILNALFITSCRDSNEKEMATIVNQSLEMATTQSLAMAKSLEKDSLLLPRSFEKGSLVTSDSRWWCSGFFPGVLWYLYENTPTEELKKYAQLYTDRVEREKFTTDNHDVGFMVFCSFGNGQRITGNEKYKDVIAKASESLSTRYKDNIHLIRSWDWNREVWQYPVIIDNMMNLEMLMWAAKETGNNRFEEIAKNHADKTMKEHFRPDYSCYHLVDYDTISGDSRIKQTVQGYSNESSWARGQAWALYGYTMMARETEDADYLSQAEKIAEFILNHPNLPDDKIPYWDFNAPNIPNEFRDASAGAIMASAFIELSRLTKDEKLVKKCKQTAVTQLKTLSSPEYLAKPGENGNFILKHSVGSLPGKSEIDVPLTYADYYYVEALMRYKDVFMKE